MKPLDWSKEKNEELTVRRGVSFEEVAVAIEEGHILDILSHPNPKKYPGQKIFLIRLHDYVFAVPYAEDTDKIFLKTIIPSRKYTKQYLHGTGP
jgi:uncharacterized DUF497 family protein